LLKVRYGTVSDYPIDYIHSHSKLKMSSVDSGTAAEDSVTNGTSTIHRETFIRVAEDAVQSKRHVVPDAKVAPSNPVWYSREGVQSYQEQVLNMTPEEWLHAIFPVTKCLKVYDWKTTLPKDLIAGCTVGFMVIPQSLSYAKLAGLPVQYGLYSAMLPIFVYSVFGTSRQLSVGPVALVSLVVANGIGSLLKKQGVSSTDKAYKQLYIAAAIQTSFLVGVTYLILGLLRLGFVTILLSHAVVSGFISASAIIIGTSQLKYFFGYSIAQTEILHHICQELVKGLDQFNWRTFLLGISALALLIFMKEIGKYVPQLKYIRVLGPLTVTIFGIILDAAINLPHHDIPIVGTIPKGLPSSTIHYWTPIHDFNELAPVVLSVGLVGFMESIAIAKRMASQHKYSIDSSSELVGLGLSNFLGSMAGAYPVTGSFSRSAVNNDTGAQTQLSGIVTGVIVLFVLLFLTSIFEKVVSFSLVISTFIMSSYLPFLAASQSHLRFSVLLLSRPLLAYLITRKQ
jgi:sulfate transporter 4